MNSTSSSKSKPIGVIGMGSFGTAIANNLAERTEVLAYVRRPEVVEQINSQQLNGSLPVHPEVRATQDIEAICQRCETLFFMIPSAAFTEVTRSFAPFLHPYHRIIHGTKGLALNLPPGQTLKEIAKISRNQMRTMSEVILEETVVIRVGCLAGPNLARELMAGKPAATVIASKYNEVILEGQRLLRSDKFQVYGNADIIGVELSGVLKNIIAIAAGALEGMGLGENARGLLISRGMVELIYLGNALGGGVKPFMGLAGIGDLVATCSSNLSRNYTVGYRLAKGEKLPDIIASMEEVAEGINTIRLIKAFLQGNGLRAPITENLYKVLFEELPIEDALQYLMKYPFSVDVDFL
ncbi:MAG: NAD(P)H-dependent glycerol-3-phosphate dehydrogenase [Nitritalea sp.]